LLGILIFQESKTVMPQIIGRRVAIAALLSIPAFLAASASGCGGDPNQFANGTMIKPSEIIEKRDELRAKKEEALAKSKKKKR
jgi:hypothetical protein